MSSSEERKVAIPEPGRGVKHFRAFAPLSATVGSSATTGPHIILYENVDFGGRQYRINIPTQGCLIPDGWANGYASSLEIKGTNATDWCLFYETPSNVGDDMLWVQGPGKLRNLHAIERPHGNNHWGDRIRGIVAVVQDPKEEWKENSTIIYKHQNSFDVGTKGARDLGQPNKDWWE